MEVSAVMLLGTNNLGYRQSIRTIIVLRDSHSYRRVNKKSSRRIKLARSFTKEVDIALIVHTLPLA